VPQHGANAITPTQEVRVPDPRLDSLHPDWSLEGPALKRQWRFADFAEALQAVNVIGDISEAANHHPDLEFGWGYVRVRVTTHDAGGLTELDFALAKALDQRL
jgi:4a-hydroxytetrahydrobiopterin dehydratase